MASEPSLALSNPTGLEAGRKEDSVAARQPAVTAQAATDTESAKSVSEDTAASAGAHVV